VYNERSRTANVNLTILRQFVASKVSAQTGKRSIDESPPMNGLWCERHAVRLRRDLPLPIPAPGEIRLRVRMAGICDTDLQLARGYMGFRGVLGHEFVAEAEDGRRVTAEINNACRDCETCRRGMPNHCPNRTVLGILGHDGAMAEFVCVPSVNLHAIPDSVPDESAVLIEPLAAAIQMADQSGAEVGDEMAILGDGKLGQLCVRAALLTGARVHLIGKHAEKLARAPDGVETHLLSDVPGLRRNFEIVVDATGSRSGLESAMTLVRPRGTIVLKTTVAARYDVDLSPIVIDEIRLLGSRCGPFEKAIAAIEGRRVDLAGLPLEFFPLDAAEAAFAHAATPGVGKVVLRIAGR
jgi:threonine dehydrogenase-like Zn-dependent dehydrogenase